MTQHREASQLAVSDPSCNLAWARWDERLICPKAEIFDPQAVEQQLCEAIDAAGDPASVRKATVTVLRREMANGRAAIAAALAEQPEAARPTVQAYAYLTDCIIDCVFRVAVDRLHPLNTPTPDWEVWPNLPNGRSGKAAFVANVAQVGTLYKNDNPSKLLTMAPLAGHLFGPGKSYPGRNGYSFSYSDSSEWWNDAYIRIINTIGRDNIDLVMPQVYNNNCWYVPENSSWSSLPQYLRDVESVVGDRKKIVLGTASSVGPNYVGGTIRSEAQMSFVADMLR